MILCSFWLVGNTASDPHTSLSRPSRLCSGWGETSPHLSLSRSGCRLCVHLCIPMPICRAGAQGGWASGKIQDSVLCRSVGLIVRNAEPEPCTDPVPKIAQWRSGREGRSGPSCRHTGSPDSPQGDPEHAGSWVRACCIVFRGSLVQNSHRESVLGPLRGRNVLTPLCKGRCWLRLFVGFLVSLEVLSGESPASFLSP